MEDTSFLPMQTNNVPVCTTDSVGICLSVSVGDMSVCVYGRRGPTMPYAPPCARQFTQQQALRLRTTFNTFHLSSELAPRCPLRSTLSAILSIVRLHTRSGTVQHIQPRSSRILSQLALGRLSSALELSLSAISEYHRSLSRGARGGAYACLPVERLVSLNDSLRCQSYGRWFGCTMEGILWTLKYRLFSVDPLESKV